MKPASITLHRPVIRRMATHESVRAQLLDKKMKDVGYFA
jgi:hypothetical protein